jgi:DnaJ like chaperone protein
MTLWQQLLAGFKAMFGGRHALAPRRSVAFTVAVIALAAKMAKADGRVTHDEIRAFRQSFHVPPQQVSQVARVFDLARRSVHGFDFYAARLGRMFAEDPAVLEEVLDVLFHIAEQDGGLKPGEVDFLAATAAAMGLSPGAFARVRAGRGDGSGGTPHEVLGVLPDADAVEIKAAWRRLVRELHPDHLVARGMPEAFIMVARERLIAVNHAYEALSRRELTRSAGDP